VESAGGRVRPGQLAGSARRGRRPARHNASPARGRCHFLGPIELLWLWRTQPDKVREWQELEAAKLARFAAQQAARGQPNHAVFGARTVAQALEDAARQFGDLPTEELERIRFSRGHCVRSRY
jgi:hypothetical protein